MLEACIGSTNCGSSFIKDNGNLKGDTEKTGPSRREFLRLAGLAAGGGALLAANRELLSTPNADSRDRGAYPGGHASRSH
jgi:hypothetical protein